LSSLPFFFRNHFTTHLHTLSLHDALPISPHGGHPCLKLTVTTAFTVQDFNLIEYVHALHTKEQYRLFSNIVLPLFILFLRAVNMHWIPCTQATTNIG